MIGADMCYAAAMWFEGLLRIMNIKIHNAGFLDAYFGHSQKILLCTLKHLQMAQAGLKLAKLPGDLKLP